MPRAQARLAATTTDNTGLRIERQPCGWEVIHTPSGLSLGFSLRLRRQAAAALEELQQTGVDFTRPAAELKKNGLRKAGRVSSKWRKRQDACCQDGEHYSAMTYALDGRCSGNGQPRRS